MDGKRDGDYRDGLFWLISGGAFVILGLARFSDRLGVQMWYFFALGLVLFLLATMVVPRKTPVRDQWRRGFVTTGIAFLVNILVVVASDEISFPGIFPIIGGVLWMVLGVWLMLRPEPTSGGAGR